MTKTIASINTDRVADGTLAAFIERNKAKPVLFAHLKGVIDAIFGVLKAINEKNKERNARLDVLERRCAELESNVALAAERVKSLEARPDITYEGVWDATKTYERGQFVTHGGSLWHEEAASINHRPGMEPAFWKLAVKRGADAKHADARP